MGLVSLCPLDRGHVSFDRSQWNVPDFAWKNYSEYSLSETSVEKKMVAIFKKGFDLLHLYIGVGHAHATVSMCRSEDSL